MTYELGGLEGKVAVVTGAGRMRSIGRSTAVELARAGCDLVVTGTGRSPGTYPLDEQEAGWTDIESVADEVRKLGRRAVPLVCDVTSPVAIGALSTRITEEFGRLDIVVNNAGAARGADRAEVLELELDALRTVLEVNLIGTFLVSKLLGNMLKEQGTGGSIVNISSVASKVLLPTTAAYAASKAATEALAACMARELAPHNIRVNTLRPGLIDTSRVDDYGRGDAWNTWVRQTIPLQRAGAGQDISSAVVFLCSDQAAWVTGQCWNIDGGQAIS